jgi:hypothetical protein
MKVVIKVCCRAGGFLERKDAAEGSVVRIAAVVLLRAD